MLAQPCKYIIALDFHREYLLGYSQQTKRVPNRIKITIKTVSTHAKLNEKLWSLYKYSKLQTALLEISDN